MSYTYANRKRADSARKQPETAAAEPSQEEALRSGAVQPTAEQMGRRVDLPEVMRAKMESAFGADLSAVKLYESQAVEDAGAKAMARGSDIAFAPGMLDFTSYGGQALLGHEISHVVSQARGEVTGSGFLNDSALEARADREGAMAAAGQQIAMPTTALSGVTAAAAAGPMQAKEKDKSKKGKAAPAMAAAAKPAAPISTTAPEQVSFGSMETLKPSLNQQGASVAKVGGVGAPGQSAVVKTGVNASLEKTYSMYHNLAGEFYGREPSKWKFGAPDARPLTREEMDAARPLVESGQLHSLSTDKKNTTEDELKNMAVFSMAGGKSRFDTGDRSKLYGPQRERFDNDASPITANPSPEEGSADYERMMGYIAMTDMVTGNTDRLAGSLNTDNWMEDRDAHRVNLIDNDFQRDEGLRYGEDSRNAWLTSLIGKVTDPEDKSGKSVPSTKQFMKNLTQYDEGAARLFGSGRNDHALSGASQAVADLPAMREQLAQKFQDANGGKDMDGFQKELLERMQITHELMTDPQMAEIYKKLSKVGMFQRKGPDGKPETESDETVKTRQDLLAQRDSRRAELEAARAKAKGMSAEPDIIDMLSQTTEDFDANPEGPDPIDVLSKTTEDFDADLDPKKKKPGA